MKQPVLEYGLVDGLHSHPLRHDRGVHRATETHEAPKHCNGGDPAPGRTAAPGTRRHPDQIRQHRAAAQYLDGLRAQAPANALKVRVLTAALKSSYAELAKLRQRVADAAKANKPDAGYVETAKPAAGAATATVPASSSPSAPST